MNASWNIAGVLHGWSFISLQCASPLGHQDRTVPWFSFHFTGPPSGLGDGKYSSHQHITLW